MVLIQRMYSERPKYNYYIGSSQGGREALTVAQRYPNDYDGVGANVPIVNFSSLMLAPHFWCRTRTRIRWTMLRAASSPLGAPSFLLGSILRILISLHSASEGGKMIVAIGTNDMLARRELISTIINRCSTRWAGRKWMDSRGYMYCRKPATDSPARTTG
jgi:pimeloyl-ACP methyl ester carboxylesterase